METNRTEKKPDRNESDNATEQTEAESGASAPNGNGVEAATASPDATGEGASLGQARAAAEQARQDLLYLRAEFENFKRRVLREQDQAIKFANEKLTRDLLPVIDLFERALSSTEGLRAKNDPAVNGFLTGIEMTHREFIQILGRFGVEFIGTVGEKFDPVRFEAISQQEVDEGDKDGTVLQVLQRGCLLQGRLLTPAKVVVGRLKST